MKTDARVRYTKKVIKDVFLKLLLKKPVEKITVTEICEAAEINRATFYKHYQDVYDLKEKLENEVYDNFMNELRQIEEKGLRGTMISILETLRENLTAYAALCGSDAHTGLANRMISTCYEMFAQKNVAELKTPDGNSEYMQKLTYAYISAGSSGIIRYWAQTGMKASPEVIADAVTDLVMRSLRD